MRLRVLMRRGLFAAVLLLGTVSPAHSLFDCDTYPYSEGGVSIGYTCNGSGYGFCCGCSTYESGTAYCVFPPNGCGWSCGYYAPWGYETINFTCETDYCGP